MPPQMKTGITGLDRILEGGFFYHNSILLKGPPGSGKTTLGIQIIHNGAMQFNEPGIIVLFEQFPQQLFRDLSSYHWDIQKLIDEKKIAVIFAQPDEVIEGDQVADAPLVSKIHDAVVDMGAKRILIDSISHFLHIIKPRLQEREFLLKFINSLKSIGLTPFMTAEMAGVNAPPSVEEYLSDCVLILSNEASKDKTFPMRQIEIKKTRGHGHVRGHHPLRIGENGIDVFPHILPESFGKEIGEEVTIEKISSGINGLNELLGGGFTRGTSTIVAGMPGTYKTTMGVQFLEEGAESGEKGLLLTFNERPQFLVSTMEQRGLHIQKHLSNGNLRIWHFFPKDYYVDELLFLLEEELNRGEVKRVVIDAINELERSIEDSAMYKDYISAFLSLLTRSNVTSLFLQKIDQLTGNAALTNIKYASRFDGIIYVGTVELESAVQKVISVMKMRGGDYTSDLRRIACGEKGLYVSDKFVGVSGILSGNPQGQYKKTVEEIFQPLYFLQDFTNMLATSEMDENQKQQVIRNLRDETTKLVEKLKEYFDLEGLE